SPGIYQGGGGPTRAGSVLRREEELERLEKEITRSSAELKTALTLTETLRGGRVEAQAALEDANRELREAEEAQRAEEARGAETERRIREAEEEGERKERDLEGEIALKAEKDRAVQASRERFGGVKGAADDLEIKARDSRRELNELTERLHRAELEHAESESEMRVLVERVRNEYELDLATWTAPPAGGGAG